MDETLIIWRRTGKEHGEDEFRRNPPDVVAANLRRKAEAFRTTPRDRWRWWRMSDAVLAEQGTADSDPGLFHYHLPRRHWMVVENAIRSRMGPDWPWYVHIGDVDWNADLDCWVFTDLFVDVLVHRDRRTHTVVDLDDLALAIDLGLAPPEVAARILRHTQELVDSLQTGAFPPPELDDCRRQLRARGLLP